MNVSARENDGYMASVLDRKISNLVTQQLLKTPITPNQITALVTLIGLAAGWSFAQGTPISRLVGAFLFWASSVLGGCDGEVARARHRTSRLGRWLNLWSSCMILFAVVYGLGLGLSRDTAKAIYEQLGFLSAVGTLLFTALLSYQQYLKIRYRMEQEETLFVSSAGAVDNADESSFRHLLLTVTEILSRRNFVYLVVLLAFVGKLDWFLYAYAVGSLLYTFILVMLLV